MLSRCLIALVSFGRVPEVDPLAPRPRAADLSDAVYLLRNKPRSDRQGVILTMPDSVVPELVCRVNVTILRTNRSGSYCPRLLRRVSGAP